MHALASSFKKLDSQPHPHEEDLLKLFKECPDCDTASIEKARAVGIPWATILSLLLKYGPAFREILQVILAALEQEPPETMEERKKRLETLKQHEQAKEKSSGKTAAEEESEKTGKPEKAQPGHSPTGPGGGSSAPPVKPPPHGVHTRSEK